jgi:hypothetical protein
MLQRLPIGERLLLVSVVIDLAGARAEALSRYP